MTGFGDASEQVDGAEFSVEVRSLNNRYFKATIRLPDSIAGLEAELDSRLRKRFARGSLALTVRISSSHAAEPRRINQSTLQRYLGEMKRLAANLDDTPRPTLDLTTLLLLPGVLESGEADERSWVHHARPIVMRLTDTACDRLRAMRQAEGAEIADDLSTRRARIAEHLDAVAERAGVVVDEYHRRLQARVEELTAKAQLSVEATDLMREVAIYADRCDIAEELQRLSTHLKQFDEILAADGAEPSGRTLDFLAQELLREANTIASKSNDAQISRAIVDMKGQIDRIKEQVQNIE